MKLLFFIHTLRGGGVENVLINILYKLPQHIKPTILVWRKEGKAIERLSKNVNLIYILKGNEYLSSNFFINKIQKIYRLILSKIYLKFPQLIRRKMGNNFDREILFYHGFAKEWETILKPNSIVWVHGMLTDRKGYADEVELIKIIEKFDKIVCVSEAIKNGAIQYSEKFKSAEVVYNPIDKHIIEQKSNEKIDFDTSLPTFVSVGRLTRLKGYYPMMDIHKKLIDEGFQHRVVVIGTGEDEQEMRTLVKEKGIEDTYLILGHKNNPYPYIKSGDFFFLFSETEGYPLVVEEAKLLSKPMIVTDVGGIPEIVKNEETAIIIPRDNDAMYHAMKRFLTDESLTQMLSENCKKQSAKYDESEMYRHIIKIITEK